MNLQTRQDLEKALDFISASDVVSKLVRGCGIGLCALSLLAFLGAVLFVGALLLEMIFSLIGYWCFAIFLPLIGWLLVRFPDLPFEFIGKELLGVFVVVSLLVSVAAAIMILVLNALVPALFFAACALYVAVVMVQEKVNRELKARSAPVRRLAAAVLRAKRETALLLAVAFAFVLATQINAVVWSAFDSDALWLWESVVRPLSKLPQPSPVILVAVVLSFAAISALQPRHRMVQRALTGLKAYKSVLALLTAMAAFTFLTSASVNSLHRQLLLKRESSKDSAERVPNAHFDPKTANHRAAWICYRLQVATPEERNRLAVELEQLPRANEEGWQKAAAQHVAELMDQDLRNEALRSESTGPSQTQAESRSSAPSATAPEAEAAFAEARRAVTTALSTLIQEQLKHVKLDDSLLASFASDLLESVLPAVPDAVLPQNITDLAGTREWISNHFSKQYAPGLEYAIVAPDWDSVRQQAGISVPPFGTQIVVEAAQVAKELDPAFDEPARFG